MSNSNESSLGINSWLEEELYQQYLHNKQTVTDQWKQVFDTDGANGTANGSYAPPALKVAVAPAPPAVAAPAPVPAPPVAAPAADTAVARTESAPTTKPDSGPAEQLVPLRGAALKIAENMNLSLSVPTATSNRVIPVKVLDENRRIINEHRELTGKSKLSYTHLIGWAIVQALKSQPNINNAYAEKDGAAFRFVRNQINFGLAIDVAGKDGTRSLVVPYIKNTGEMTFAQYQAGFDDLVQKGRTGKLSLPDFQGTTISLTNPGTVGTVGSVPRLMPGQGAIIATGAMDFPAEYAGVAAETKAALGLSKVMAVSCTYDHRVIQGAESGMFLGRLQDLLQGKDGFYDGIFADLAIPYRPVVWQTDASPSPFAGSAKAPEVNKEAAILQLINAYRTRGHLMADLNPLKPSQQLHAELDPATYRLSMWDMDREFNLGSLGSLTGTAAPKPVCTLRELLESLRRAYCGRMGVEYMDNPDVVQKKWLQERLEGPAAHAPLAPEVKTRILRTMLEAEMFEQFLENRYKGQKRFSVEGGESSIAAINEICEVGGTDRVHEVVIGMAHRGRLTVISNLVGGAARVFSAFEGAVQPENGVESDMGDGDVKYHLGASGERRNASGHDLVVTVLPNPSHLEAVNPVVEGYVRPKQDRLGDLKRARVIPLLIHGDAAFIGQGVVMETMNLSRLSGYSTGGTIHMAINNQVGFTTNPDEARSSTYCTDIARMIAAPVFHVNGDDPEACARAAHLAYAYRQTFSRDVVIDVICYRKYGHNEGDDPTYTQPVMYKGIREHVSPATQYRDRLIREKIITADQVEAMRRQITANLEERYQEAKQNAQTYEIVEVQAVEDRRPANSTTGISEELFRYLITNLHALPEDLKVQEKVVKTVIERRLAAANGGAVDWALGEALAFGSLLTEGTPVRLSGQDVTRGTFSQRHLAYVDVSTNREYLPIKQIAAAHNTRVEIVDSSLSEFAVMGFEYGFSVSDPQSLVLWEGQFGDFVNGAQIMVDQFISSGESKWGQHSSLTLLLPHGYEGQGPEHSSARMERFLQLCAENNLIVANCTTPANYFHLLRRQMRGGETGRGTQKPLVVFTPKSILRHAKAVSHMAEFTGGSFREVLGDTTAPSQAVTRVVFCTGKVYYDLADAREKLHANHVAIVRLEQIYPFPGDRISDILARYSASAEIVWVQEEPKNMGAWWFVERKLRSVLRADPRTVRYVGRTAAASPATGLVKQHASQQAAIVESAFAPVLPPINRHAGRKKVRRRKAS